MPSWRTLARQVVFEQPPWLVVELHQVELPDGQVIPDWTWVRTPDYVNVVVLTVEGDFLCFRQRKYGIPDEMLALVGGYIKPEETPLQAAQRELREETGYESEDWLTLGEYLVDPNRGIASSHLFLARQAWLAGQIDSDDLEEQAEVRLNREELEKALEEGKFKILAWAAAVAFALRQLPPGKS